MFSPLSRLRRWALMAPLLLLLLLSPSQPQPALAYSPQCLAQEYPSIPMGYIDIAIWADMLAYNGFQWQQAWSPMDYYFLMMDNYGAGKFYSYETNILMTEDGNMYIECGYFLEWDVSASSSPPPECKLIVVIELFSVPGACWGQIGGVPVFEFSEPESFIDPGNVSTSFIIGEEIFKVIHHEDPVLEGNVYVLLQRADLFGAHFLGTPGCYHHAFRP